MVVVGPVFAARWDPTLTQSLIFMRSDFDGAFPGYASAGGVSRRSSLEISSLARGSAAGVSRIVSPGVLRSTALWLIAASLYSYYLNLSDYSRFSIQGLSQLMVAMIFFQMTAVIVILGAELNRGIFEFSA